MIIFQISKVRGGADLMRTMIHIGEATLLSRRLSPEMTHSRTGSNAFSQAGQPASTPHAKNLLVIVQIVFDEYHYD
jgi:hypothetical protein